MKITTIEGVGPVNEKKLHEAGVKSAKDLLHLAKDAKGRAALEQTSGISRGQLLKWANMADLMRVRGVGKEYSELLEAAGVDTVKELARRNADNLQKKMQEINDQKNLVRRCPTMSEVDRWVEVAKSLDPMISH